MKVSEFMTKNVISLSTDKTVQDAAEIMIAKNISVIPVVDSNSKLVGIITESDFIAKDAEIPHALASIKRLLGQIFYHSDVENIFENAKTMTLDKVMSHNPRTVGPDDGLSDVVDMMSRFHLKRVPVVQGGELVGIITRHDIMRAFTMLKKLSNQEEQGQRPTIS